MSIFWKKVSNIHIFFQSSDYNFTSIPSSVTIPAREIVVYFDVIIIDDDLAGEGTESFNLSITDVSPDGVGIFEGSIGIFIQDDDSKTLSYIASIIRAVTCAMFMDLSGI